MPLRGNFVRISQLNFLVIIPIKNPYRSFFSFSGLSRNLRACTEIVKTSYELNLPLTENQHVQFFNVLLKKPVEKKLITPLHKTIYPLKF